MASNWTIREIIRNRHKDIISEVDPNDVIDHLIQKRVVSLSRQENIMRKKTKEKRCRALLDWLFECPDAEAFIYFREALQDNYSWIVKRIDADYLRKIIFDEYKGIVSDVNPEVVLDYLIHKQLTSIDRKQEIMSKSTRKEQCRALLDWILKCSNDEALVVFKNVLQHHYHWILERHEAEIREITSNFETAQTEELPTNTSAFRGIRACMSHTETSQGQELTTGTLIRNQLSSRSEPCLVTRIRVESSGFISVFSDVGLHDRTDPSVPAPLQPIHVHTIKERSRTVRGVAMMDNFLFVAWFGSSFVHAYNGNEEFKKDKHSILISAPHRRGNLFNRLPLIRAKLASEIQDIASCEINRCLYVSDGLNRCIHRVNPQIRKVVASWNVEEGIPYGISVTSHGNVVVSFCKSGQMSEYTGEGTFVRCVSIELGPRHGFRLGIGFWIFCHGKNNGEGHVRTADLDGNCFAEAILRGPYHLALLPDRRILVGENKKDCITMFDESLTGPGQVILGPAQGISMPVRLHFCPSSGQLIVGLRNGSVLIFQTRYSTEQNTSC